MPLQIHGCCNDTIFWIFKPSTTVSGQPCPEGPQTWCNSTLLTEIYGGNGEESTLIAFHFQTHRVLQELAWPEREGWSSSDKALFHRRISMARLGSYFLSLSLPNNNKKSIDRSLRSSVILIPFPPTIWVSLTLSHHVQSPSINVTSKHW